MAQRQNRRQDSRGRYASEFYDDVHGFEELTPVTVAAGEVVSGINASLDKGAHMTGRVTGRMG